MTGPLDESHTGFVVPALEPAMAELSAVFGVTWTSIEDRRMPVLTPEGGLRIRIRFVYSTEGPHRLELIEPVEGTCWEQPAYSTLGLGAAHHVGVWADDITGTSERLVADGFPRVLTLDLGDGRAHGFAYHRLPSGALIELVDAAWRPGLEAWFAGGAYPDGRSGS